MKNPLCDEFLIYQPTGAEVQDFYPWYIVSCVFNILPTITAIVLNSVTIQALRKASSLSKPLKTLLLSLAFTDLGVGLLCHPFATAFLIKWSQQNLESYLFIYRTVLVWLSLHCMDQMHPERCL